MVLLIFPSKSIKKKTTSIYYQQQFLKCFNTQKDLMQNVLVKMTGMKLTMKNQVHFLWMREDFILKTEFWL